MSKRARRTRGQASSSYEETMEEKCHKCEPLHKGVTYRLGGVEREMSLLEFRWKLTKYLKNVRDKSVIFEGMFVTRIARSFGLLTNEMVSVLNREPPSHVYRKTSLVKMGTIMELHEGECSWPATKRVVEESKGDDEEGNREGGNKGVGGSQISTTT
nr:hypothetical protein [Tanacetum cinerariifolium]